MTKRILSVVLVLSLFLSVIPALSTKANATANIVINGVDIGYAHNSYFTKNGSTCKDYNNYDANGVAQDRCHKRTGYNCETTIDPSCNCMRYWPTGIKSTCQVDLGGSQCFGYARYCQWKVYGSFATSASSTWADLTGVINAANCTASTLEAKLKGCSPATHVRMPSPHSISIISTDDNGVTFTDCNSDGCCIVRKTTMTWTKFASYVQDKGGINYAYSRIDSQNIQPPNNMPFGFVETVAVGTQKVVLQGWVFDKDDIDRNVAVHVYIGDTLVGSTLANEYREDVGNAYGVGNYHGFWVECAIPVDKTGQQTLLVYAIDQEADDHPRLFYNNSEIVVDIPSNHVPFGFVENVAVGTQKVVLQGWVFDEDDIDRNVKVHVYIDDTFVGSTVANEHREDVGNAYAVGNYHGFWVECTIPADKTGQQTLQVYAIDQEADYYPRLLYKDAEIVVDIPADTQAPMISDVKITSIDASGYTISCKVTDNTGINKVQFPVWTEPLQDDLPSDWGENPACSGTKNGDIYTFRVNISDHNYETSRYVTHIYAWDNYGNYISHAIDGEITVSYKITFDANGGTGAPGEQIKVHDTILTLPSTQPTRSGYTFAGWATDSAAATVQYHPGDNYSANADVTLYAVWKTTCENGHDYSYEVTTAPTSSKTGILTGVCTRCSQSITTTLPVLNPNDYNIVVQNGIGHCTLNSASFGKIIFEVVVDIPGDLNGDGTADETDVIQLLWHTLFPEDFEIYGEADFNHDGNTDEDDVIYLLWYTLFPDDYPLT